MCYQKKRFSVVLFATVLCIIIFYANIVFAQDAQDFIAKSEKYIEADYAILNLDAEVDDWDLGALLVRGGMEIPVGGENMGEFSPKLQIEALLGIGIQDETWSENYDHEKVELNTIFGVMIKGVLAMKKFSLNGGIGFAAVDGSRTISGDAAGYGYDWEEEYDYSETSLSFTFGVGFRFDKHSAVELGYGNYYSDDDVTMGGVHIGYRYYF